MRHLKYVLLFFSAYFITLYVSAQGFSQDYWHNGLIITAKGDTLKGEIRYHLEQEVVQLLVENQVSTYTPVNTDKVIFVDTLTRQTRYLLVKPRLLKNGIVVKNFFEYENVFQHYLLLSREQIVYTANSSVSGLGFGGDTRELDHLYFLWNKEEFIQLDLSKKTLYALFGAHADKVWEYMREHKLKLRNHADVNTIFSFYNQLSHEPQATNISN